MEDTKNTSTMDRRSFLGRLGAVGAAGVAASAFPWLEACAPKTTAQTAGSVARIGIIGPGSRGKLHIRNLLNIPNARITALCDIYPTNLDAASALVPDARRYTDYRALLEDPEVDAVVIATPLDRHFRMAMDAMDAGKHVFCEKAIAYTIDECYQMYRKHQETGRVLLIGQQRLFDPKYLKAMDAVRRGDYGPVVNVRNYWFRNNDWRRPVPSPELERHINWRLYREYSRGLMTELACHQLQNGTWATGMLPVKVMGTGGYVYWKDGREVFDSVCAIYTFPNGVNMTFESVIANKHFGMGEFILCKEGTVDLPGNRFYAENPPQKSAMRQLIGDIEKGIFSNAAFASSSWSAENARADKGVAVLADAKRNSAGRLLDGSYELMQTFCNAAISGEQPPHALEEAYYGSVFCLLGDEAILQEKTLELPEQYLI